MLFIETMKQEETVYRFITDLFLPPSSTSKESKPKAKSFLVSI